jgi:hypothetical protein
MSSIWEDMMNVRSLQGLALILSAIFTLVGFLGPDTALFNAILSLSTILFIVGIPAVYTTQPIGTAGLVGVILMIVAALIALGFRLLDLPLSEGVQDVLIWISILSGLAGRLIVGWLTTRHRVFPAWVGWALMAEGVLLFPFGDLGSIGNVLTIIVIVLGAVALLGYGYYLFRPRVTPAMA